MNGSFQAHAAKLARAAEVVSAQAEASAQAVAISLNEAAQSLPTHIIAATDPVKLNKQAPLFRCPAWAGLPSTPFHLHCERGKVPFPALGLHRFPYYLFGKSPVCDYVFEHPSISSLHAALIFHKENACFVLLDLGSTNGVRLQGKRVEPRRPVPIALGTVLQFGYSTRTYELRAGPPPSAKRLREGAAEEKEVGRQLGVRATSSSVAKEKLDDNVVVPLVVASPCNDHSVAALQSSVPPASPSHHAESSSPTNEIVPERNVAPTSSKDELNDQPGAVLSSSTAATSPLPPIHLFQLVIKHKDVENRVSRGCHNKGEIITRSRADAIEMARSIVADHQRQVPVDVSRGFSPWSVEEFVTAVTAYCEVSGKKKRGDLGMVEKGMFADEIDQAAFQLRCGEVSVPVETQLGIHLLYRCD